MRLFFSIPLALVLSSASLAANAWSKQGHQIIGELAERQLSATASAQVKALLLGEADPSLAGISSWADDVRDHDPDLGKRSFAWHFVNFPRGMPCAYVPERDCPDGNCVIGAINAQLEILADRRQPLDARRQALKFIVHFVADIHQPLHTGFADDRGGNDYQLNYHNEGSNLHAIWDYRIVHDTRLETKAYVDRLLASPNPGNDVTLKAANPAAAWALESCAIVHAAGFYPPKGRLDERYIQHYRPVAEDRLRRAGRRLAALLETALAPGSTTENNRYARRKIPE